MNNKSANETKKSHEYLMGYDCALNGANKTNCNFSLFSTPEKTKQWEQGKIDATKINQTNQP